MTDRLAELEAKAAALNAEIAALKSGKAPPPPPPRDEVRIVAINDERSDGMPALRELEKLYGVVKHLAPWPLNDKHDPDRPFRGFTASFRWLANKGRTESPNSRFALNFWLDDCRNWLRARNSVGGDVDASTLILAVYASADIKYVSANGMLGHVWELGLAEHAGRPANADAWRKILREGASAILPPSAPAKRTPAPSNVRVVVGY